MTILLIERFPHHQDINLIFHPIPKKHLPFLTIGIYALLSVVLLKYFFNFKSIDLNKKNK